MGNCLFGGLGDQANCSAAIRVTTANGGVMEFFPPVSAGSVAEEFPGHGVYRSRDLFWTPLARHDALLAGHSYHLLPLTGAGKNHVRSSSFPEASSAAPYRMSCEHQGALKRSYTEVFGDKGVGFWRVKLVISPEQLAEILSQEGSTRELIESVRTVAKCGGGGISGGFSDQWSLSSSSRNASCKVDELMVSIVS